MNYLAQKSCHSCILGVKLSPQKIEEYKSQISLEWDIKPGNNIDKLYRRWKFKNFKEAKGFVDRISELAEAEGHHPNITFSYDYAEIILYTHKAGGLAEEDFILAAKIDNLAQS